MCSRGWELTAGLAGGGSALGAREGLDCLLPACGRRYTRMPALESATNRPSLTNRRWVSTFMARRCPATGDTMNMSARRAAGEIRWPLWLTLRGCSGLSSGLLCLQGGEAASTDCLQHDTWLHASSWRTLSAAKMSAGTAEAGTAGVMLILPEDADSCAMQLVAVLGQACSTAAPPAVPHVHRTAGVHAGGGGCCCVEAGTSTPATMR